MNDPLDVPDYVAESLRAWCATHPRRETPHVPESVARRDDPTYDPEWDWLDEPFPEEYE